MDSKTPISELPNDSQRKPIDLELIRDNLLEKIFDYLDDLLEEQDVRFKVDDLTDKGVSEDPIGYKITILSNDLHVGTAELALPPNLDISLLGDERFIGSIDPYAVRDDDDFDKAPTFQQFIAYMRAKIGEIGRARAERPQTESSAQVMHLRR